MRSDFETPIDFPSEKIVEGHTIIYRQLMEISQGSPMIGKLEIDNQLISMNDLFGGPFLYERGYIYIPLYFNNFFSSGFKLARINIETKSMEIIITKKENLFFLEKIEDNTLYYYPDMDENSLTTINIHS
ncbi:hypothetical protein [Spirosoma jeollabukense]